MSTTVSFTITGMGEMSEALQRGIAQPKANLLNRWALQTQARAQHYSPVDTGRLRSSITFVVEGDTAHVGTAIQYGPYVEWGTRPHWPPTTALERWAKAHGMVPFLVARAIAMRGTPAQPYMRPAYYDSRALMPKFLEMFAAEVKQEMSRAG